jgi:hypothetical protein
MRGCYASGVRPMRFISFAMRWFVVAAAILFGGWRTTASSQPVTTYEADDVLRQYAATLQSGGHGVIRDASELPYPKEVIRIVLQHAIKVSKEDKQTLEMLKSAYVALADFQRLTKEERDALAVLEEGALSGLSTAEQAERISQAGKIYAPVVARYRAELDDIGKELGLSPRPPASPARPSGGR